MMSMNNIFSALCNRVPGQPYVPPVTDFKELYILAGQSNCGRTRTSEMDSEELEEYGEELVRTFIYNKPVSTSSIALLEPGVNTMLTNQVYADEFGPEVSLFKSFEDADEIDRYLIKHGVGSSYLSTQWNSRTPGGIWTDFLNQIVNAVSAIRATGVHPRLKAFIWMQGENDSITESDAEAYLTNLTNFFDDFSLWAAGQGILGEQDYVKVIGRINGINDPVMDYRDIVRQAQEDYCDDPDNNAIMIDTDDYGFKDVVHYDASGQIQFGLDIFNALTS